MNELKLKRLLVQIDRSSGLPSTICIDMDQLKRRAWRLRALRTLSAVAAGLLALVSWMAWERYPQSLTSQTRFIAQVTALDVETEQLLRLMDSIEQQQVLQEKMRKIDAQVAVITKPLQDILDQADQVAASMVADAQRLYQQRKRRQAILRYQRVIDLFPQSLWAQVADRRLSEIHKELT